MSMPPQGNWGQSNQKASQRPQALHAKVDKAEAKHQNPLRPAPPPLHCASTHASGSCVKRWGSWEINQVLIKCRLVQPSTQDIMCKRQAGRRGPKPPPQALAQSSPLIHNPDSHAPWAVFRRRSRPCADGVGGRWDAGRLHLHAPLAPAVAAAASAYTARSSLNDDQHQHELRSRPPPPALPAPSHEAARCAPA